MVRALVALVLVCLISVFTSSSTPVNAATGINHQINFQGKLVNTNGTNVTDGTYSIVYSIYTVASAGTNIWTETQSVTVTNGIFQVALGSVTTLPGSIDFNTDNIYLGVKVGSDAEMTPRIQFTSVPQAFNSEKLGGLDKTGFIQNNTSLQTTANFNIQAANSASNGTIGGIIRGAAGGQTVDLLQLQNTGGTVLDNFTAAGALGLVGPAANGVLTVGTNTTTAAGGQYFGTDTNLYRSAASTLQTDGALNVRGSGGLTVGVAGTTIGSINLANATSSRLVVLQGLNPSGTGNATIQVPTIAGGSSDTICLLTLANCGGGGGSTLQAAYNYTSGNTITTTDARDLSVTLADTATDSNFLVNIATSSTSKFAVQSNGTDVLGVTSSAISAAIPLTSTSTVTGTTVNGTTGINTGASAGTQRIDASGNLVNIGTITSGLINGQTISSSANFTGTLAVAGASATIGTPGTTAGSLILSNAGSSRTVSLQGLNPSGTGNATIQFPTIAGGATDSVCLATLSNCSAIGAAGGDLTGTYPNPTVAKLQGTTLTISSLGSGDVLQYNGSAIVNGHITNTNLTAGTFGSITGVGALTTGSIASGFGTIATANTITGTTLNGTTGINTGASAGTQRIDSSGNIVNAGNFTAAAGSTFLTTGANGFIFKPGTDNATAFQVQNAAGSGLLNIDSLNSTLNAGITSYSTGTIAQTTTAITGTGTTFTSAMTGGTIIYNDGTTATVTYVSATSLTSSVSKTVTAGATYKINYGIVLKVDNVNSQVSVQGINSDATLGAELFTASYSFPATTGWGTISGTGSSATATHTAGGGVTALVPTPAMTVVAGNTYQVNFSGTLPTAGETVTPSIGGTSGIPTGGTSSSNSQVITATTTGNLQFTPTNNYNGTISSVSIKVLTSTNAALRVLNSVGAASLEFRASTQVGNSFIGVSSGQSNTTGSQDVALGYQALQNNTTGAQDVAIGYQALQSNTTGFSNVAVGALALLNNTVGSRNIAVGHGALQSNLGGTFNVGIGWGTLGANTTGNSNTAVGITALGSSTTGTNNTAFGHQAGYTNTPANANTIGSANTFIGQASGPGVASAFSLQNATAIGRSSIVSGNDTLTLGCISGINGCGTTTNVGIASAGYANNPLTVSATTYSTGTITASASATVTGTSTVWTSGIVGGTIYFVNSVGTYTSATITAVPTSTSLTTNTSNTITAGTAYVIVYGGVNITSTGTVSLQNTANSTAAFQIQNAAAGALLTADTSNMKVSVGATSITPTTMSARTNFASGSGPIGITSADYNGDGKPDMTVANTGIGSTTVSVFLNTTATGAATPTFSAKTDLTASTQPYGVTSADYNGDGKQDIATTNSGTTTVSVFLNTTATGAATPTFSAKTDFTTATNPRGVTSADYNGDGKPDMAVTNNGSTSVSVFLNTTATGATTPTFSAKTDFTTGINPEGVISADYNGDGKQDIATTNSGTTTVSVFLNTTATGATTPTFSAKTDFTAGTQPNGVTSADYNGDGKPDMAVTNGGSTSVSVFLNTTATGATTPTFSAKTDFTAGVTPFGVTSADYNGDGKTDMSVVNNSSATISIFLNTTATSASTPAFSTKIDFTTGSSPYGATSADYNGDGKPDMATTSGAPYASVFLNTTATGAATPKLSVSADALNPGVTVNVTAYNTANAITIVDANGNTLSSVDNTGSTKIGIRANGFTYAAKNDFTTGTNPYSVTSADYNGDGKLDMAVANDGAATVSVFLNTAVTGSVSPTFSAKTDFTTGTGPWSVTSADFNGDGKPDMAVANISVATVSVFLNTTATGASTPTFSAKTDFTTGTSPWSVTTADFNGDGKPDMAVTNDGSITVSVFLNTTATGASTPTFSAKTDFTTGTFPRSVTTADYNGDGKPDMAVANANPNSVSVFLNTTATGASTPTFSAKTDFTTGTTPINVTSADYNGDGKPDMAVANNGSTSVSVFLNTTANGAGTPAFSAKTDFTTGTNPHSVTSADYNADGKPDMAVANNGSTSVSVFINATFAGASTPSFSAKSDFTVGTNPRSVTSADFNGDGKPDMAIANDASTSVSVFLNQYSSGGRLEATSNSASSVAAVVQGFSGQTANLLEIHSANGAILDSIDATGKLTVNSTALFKNITNDTNAFQVQNAGGTQQAININTVTTPNLIANHNFETNTNGWAAKGSSTLSLDDTTYQSGKRSLSIVTTAAANQGAAYSWTPTASTNYALSFYARTIAGTTATTINFGRVDVSGTDVDCLTAQSVTPTWTRYTCTFTTGATITPPSTIYIKQTDAVARTLYIDGIQLEQGITVSNTYNSQQANLQVETATSNIVLNGNNTGEIQPWQTSANPLPAIRGQLTTVIANGYIYAIGGYDGTTRQSTVYYAKVNADGTNGTWTTSGNPLPGIRAYASSVTANGYVYVIGGFNGSYQSTVFYAKLNTDGTTSAWYTAANSLPAIRGIHSSVVANGYVYVIGGSNGSAAQQTVYYAKLNADGSVGAWGSANTIPAIRSANSSVFANGYIYVTGGDNDVSAQSTVYSAKANLDGTLASWTTLSTTPLPATRELHTSLAANGYLYVIGGVSGSYQSSVYYSRINNDGTIGAWTTSVNPLPVLRGEHAGVSANGYVYVVGGYGGGYQSTILSTSLERIKVAGSLDLVGFSGQTLGDVGSGGELTAGNTNIVGNLNVAGQATFMQGLSVDKAFVANSDVLFKNQANSTGAFSVQNTASQPLLGVDTTTNNLITNPGFEVDTSNWAASGAGGPTIARNTTKSNAYYGLTSLLVTTSAGTANTGASVTGFTSAITPGTYTLSFYAMGGATNGTISTLNASIIGGGNPGCSINSAVTTSGFQRYSCSFTSATSNVTSITITVTDTTQHTFYLDGVQLTTSANNTSYYKLGSLQLRGVVTNPVTLQSGSDSTTALQILNGAGTTTALVVDTLNSRVGFGTANPQQNFVVSATGSVANFEVAISSGVVMQSYNRTAGAYGSFSFDTSNLNFRLAGASGNLVGIAAVTATTLTAATTGINVDLSTSYTPSVYNVTGQRITLPNISGAATNTYKGIELIQGSLVNTSGATSWTGLDITMPNITQSAGTLTSRGISITGGTVTSGTSYALTTTASAGNVGIGTTTPTATLDVRGNALFKNTANSATAFQIQNAAGTNVVNVGTVLTNTNLVTNGSFESNSSTGWAGKGTGTIAASTAQKLYGSYSGLVTTAATANDGVSYPVSLAANTQYTLSFNFRGVSAFTTLNVGRQDVSGTDIDCLTGQTASTSGWSRASCTFTTGGTVTSPNIYFKQSDATARTFYIDGVQLLAGAAYTNYTEGTTALAGTINSPLAVLAQEDSTNALQVFQNQNTTMSVFNVDSLNNSVSIGSQQATDTAKLKISSGSYPLIVANSTGSNDTLRLQSSGTNVLTVSSTGVALFKNSSNSTTGFQVQPSGSTTPVLDVDTTNSRVGIGIAAPVRTLDVVGDQGGNVVTDVKTAETTAATYTESTKALAYYLSADSTTTEATFTTTFNITGLSNTEGSYAYIYSTAIKGVTSATQTHTIAVQINGTQVSSVDTNDGGIGSASTFREQYIIMYINGAWRISAYGNFNNTFKITSDTADLAEWIHYTGTQPSAGEVLTVGDEAVSAKQSTGTYDPKLLGIVTTTPHTVMGADDGHSTRLALTGRVPVKVNLENGPIKAGDYLTSSSASGYAMKATHSGTVVAQALASYDGSGSGDTVVSMVKVQYVTLNDPVGNTLQGDQTVSGSLNVLGGASITGSLNVSGDTTLTNLTVTGSVAIQGTLTVTAIAVGDITVSGHIITAGGQPVTQALTSAGTDAQVAITGTDTSGTITITTGSNPTSGELAKFMFSKAYGVAPHVVMSASNDNAAGLRSYRGNTTLNDFMWTSKDVPLPNTTYQYDYFISQ